MGYILKKGYEMLESLKQEFEKIDNASYLWDKIMKVVKKQKTSSRIKLDLIEDILTERIPDDEPFILDGVFYKNRQKYHEAIKRNNEKKSI